MRHFGKLAPQDFLRRSQDFEVRFKHPELAFRQAWNVEMKTVMPVCPGFYIKNSRRWISQRLLKNAVAEQPPEAQYQSNPRRSSPGPQTGPVDPAIPRVYPTKKPDGLLE
jgi:hypothetical protein